MLPGPQGNSAGAGGGPSAGTVEVIASNVAASAYATSTIPYTPLAKNATEQYIIADVPVSSTGTVNLRMIYAMSVSNGGDVVLQVDYVKVTAAGNPDAAFTTQSSHTFAPGSGSTLKTLDATDTATLGISATAEDVLRVRVTRKNVAGDTHTGSLNAIALAVY